MVWEEAMASTGIQGFWNFDVFSLLGPTAGRPQAEAIGFVNTWNFNLCFTQTDIVTKFHNNPPFITRAYNTGVAAGDLNFRGGVSLVGKNWIMNYEYCIIEGCDGSYAIDSVTEIDPLRCLNTWTYTSGTPGTWTPPPGVFREMTKPDGNTYEVTTKDHFVYSFSKNENITIDNGSGTYNYIYVLDYIEDRNGSRVYVEWEDMSATAYDDRIKAIQVSLDQGTTKYDVIKFEYADDPGLISRYSLVAIDSLPTGTTPPNWFADMHWDFTYDGSDNLVKAEYPTGSKGRGFYTYSYDTDEFEITDMEGTKHSYYYHVVDRKWYREIWAKDGVAYYARISYEDKGSDVTEITDPETSELWEFTHHSTGGYITEIKDPDNKSHDFSWDANYQLSDITFPAIQSIVSGSPGTIISKVSFSYNGDFNLTKVEWSKDGDPANKKYTTEYTYGSGTSKNDLTKVEMHEDYAASNYFTETQFEYDSNHNLVLIRAGINPNITDATDPEDMSVAAVTRFTYTDEGSLDSVTSPEGGKVGFCYKSDISKGELGGLAKIKEYLSDGIATTVLTTYLEYYFMELRLKSVTTSGKTPTTVFSFNNIGELKVISISEGATYETRYDKMGNPIELNWPDGTTTIDYDLKTTPLNLPCSIVDPSPNDDLNKKTVSYKKNGLVFQVTFRYNQDEYETTYTYDIANRLTSVASEVVSDGATETVTFSYDDNSDLIKITDPGGNESLFFYNLVGNIIMTTAPEDDGTASPTRWERVIFTYNGPMGLASLTTFVYGSSGSYQDNHGFYYDHLGRLVRWVQPQVSYTRGETTYIYTYSHHFYYDRNSNIIMVINREYETSSGDPVTTDTRSYYTYDGFSRLVKACIEYEDEKVLDMCWYYDIYGNLLEVTEGGMKSVRMAYDDSGKLTGVYKPNQHSNQGKTYEYDKVSGKMTKKSSPGGMVTEMQYAPDGSHQSSISGPAGQKSDDCEDKTGSTATQVIPGDKPDNVIGEETKSAKTEYYENGWVKRIILPNEDYFGYSYDGLGRIITVYESVPEQDPSADDSNWPFGSIDDTAVTLTIAYDWIPDPNPPIYNLKVTYSTYKSGGDYETRYSFDNRGRLEEVEFYVGNISGGGDGWYSYTYTYDGKGNLTLVKYNNVTLITNTYNHLNQLVYQAFDNLTNSYEHSPYLTPTAKQAYSAGNESHFRDVTFTCDKVLRLLEEVDTDNILTDDDPVTYVQVTKLFEFHHDNASRIIRIKDPYYDSVENDPLQTRIAVEESPYLRTIERTDTHNPVRGHAETYNHFYDEAGRLRKVDLPDITATASPPPGDEGANQASVSVEYTYEVTGKLASVTVTSLRDDSQIYHIAYAYDDLGRMTERVVREDSSDAGWYNWATFKYDGRSQILDEKYTYSSDGSSTTLVYQAVNTYDLAGNVTSRVLKRLESSTLITYTFSSLSYSRGYQLLSFIITDDQVPNTWNYTGSYDLRGNLLNFVIAVPPPPPPPAPAPFAFPSFTYDSINNVATYTGGGTTWHLWRDPLGRVFRKADSSGVTPTSATHYYYTFSALAQEYDEHPVSEVPEDELEFDYLRGFDGHVLRRRDVEDADPDRQPLKDLLASPLNLVNADDGVMSGSTSGYTFDAWGESFEAGDTQGQPSETNHIRYHGAFTEEFVSPNDTDGVYRMGARHYSTVLGRFFQREPMTLVGLPSPANPLGVNAYLYSHNSPTTKSDISGLQMVGAASTYNEGILYPPEKPEVIPYEPLPDPDPGFEGPDDFPGKPGMMEFRIPGWIRPPWDRRNPDIPLPPNPWGWSTMSLTIPDDPGPPGTSPMVPPDLFRPKKPQSGFSGPFGNPGNSGKPGMPPIELMSMSSGGGDMPFIPGVNPITPADAAKMREQTAKVREQFAKNKEEWADKKDYQFIMHLGHGNVVAEQPKSEYNKAFWNQVGKDIIWDVAKWTGIAVVSVATVGYGAAIIANPYAAGYAYGMTRALWTARFIKTYVALGKCATLAELLGTTILLKIGGSKFINAVNIGRSALIAPLARRGVPMPHITRSGLSFVSWHRYVVINNRYIIDPIRWPIFDVRLWGKLEEV